MIDGRSRRLQDGKIYLWCTACGVKTTIDFKDYKDNFIDFYKPTDLAWIKFHSDYSGYGHMYTKVPECVK